MGILLFLALAVGCPTPHDHCAALRPGDALPTPHAAASFVGYGLRLQGNAALRCCHSCNPTTHDCGNVCGADCADPANQATPVELGAEYAGDCDSAYGSGIAHCTVWAQGDRVGATYFFCQD